MMMMVVLDMKFLRLKGTCLLDFSKQHFGAERGGLHRQPRMTLRMREAGMRHESLGKNHSKVKVEKYHLKILMREQKLFSPRSQHV